MKKCQWSGSDQNWLFFSDVSWYQCLEKSRLEQQYCVILHTTVVTYFFQDIEIRIHKRKTASFGNFPITDIFGKWLFWTADMEKVTSMQALLADNFWENCGHSLKTQCFWLFITFNGHDSTFKSTKKHFCSEIFHILKLNVI